VAIPGEQILLLCGLHFVAYFFGRSENSQSIPAENFADVVGRIAFAEQSFGNFG
jgi:hypothetical protein